MFKKIFLFAVLITLFSYGCEKQDPAPRPHGEITESAMEAMPYGSESMTPEFAKQVLFDAPQDVLGELYSFRCQIPARSIYLGESGVGKTLATKALAVLSKRRYVCLSVADLAQDAGPENMNAAYDCLRSPEPSIIVFENIHQLADYGHDEMPAYRLTGIFDQAADDSRVAFIATTNTLDGISERIISRLHGNLGVVKFPLPSTRALHNAFAHHIRLLKDKPNSHVVSENCLDDAFLDSFARRLKGCTYCDVESCINEVDMQAHQRRMLPLHEKHEPGSLVNRKDRLLLPVTITPQDFEEGVRLMKSKKPGYCAIIKSFCTQHPIVLDYGFRLTKLITQTAVTCMMQRQHMNMMQNVHQQWGISIALQTALMSQRSQHYAIGQVAAPADQDNHVQPIEAASSSTMTGTDTQEAPAATNEGSFSAQCVLL